MANKKPNRSQASINQRKEYTVKYRETHRLEIRQRADRYRRNNREKALQCLRDCNHKRYNSLDREGKLATFAKNKQYVRELKFQVIKAYGSVCVCCGEDNWEFLSIDHIDGNSKPDKIRLKSMGANFYRDLRRRGWPKDNYRLLCMNCNFSHGKYGYCLHNKSISKLMAV